MIEPSCVDEKQYFAHAHVCRNVYSGLPDKPHKTLMIYRESRGELCLTFECDVCHKIIAVNLCPKCVSQLKKVIACAVIK